MPKAPAASKTTKRPTVKPAKTSGDPALDMWKAMTRLDRAGIAAAAAAGASIDEALHGVVYAETKLSPKDVARAKLLLELGASPAYRSPEDNETTVLHELSFAPNQDAALEVLDAMIAVKPRLAAEADKLGRTPLQLAMWYGKHAPYWERLGKLGNPLATADQHGMTPLFDAISHANHKGIEWLIAKGVSLDGALAYAKDPTQYVADKTIAFLQKRGATT